MSELDKDFQETAEKINAKIKEAAEALKEANRLANEAGMAGLIYTQWCSDWISYNDPKLSRQEISDACETQEERCELIDVSPLEEELSEAGWSTSSSYC